MTTSAFCTPCPQLRVRQHVSARLLALTHRVEARTTSTTINTSSSFATISTQAPTPTVFLSSSAIPLLEDLSQQKPHPVLSAGGISALVLSGVLGVALVAKICLTCHRKARGWHRAKQGKIHRALRNSLITNGLLDLPVKDLPRQCPLAQIRSEEKSRLVVRLVHPPSPSISSVRQDSPPAPDRIVAEAEYPTLLLEHKRLERQVSELQIRVDQLSGNDAPELSPPDYYSQDGHARGDVTRQA
jgi:hypothetical protein